MTNIIPDMKYNFDDVLICPAHSTVNSRSEVNLYRSFSFRNSKRHYKGIPIIATNMDSIGTFEMAKALSKHGLFTAISKFVSVEEWKKFEQEYPECFDHVAVTVGLTQEGFNKLTDILNAVPRITTINLDIANGYLSSFTDFIRQVREAFPNHTIIAGNVVTPDKTKEIILAGADIVKIGFSAGSVCWTRLKTGVGYPKLSAVMECSKVAHDLQAHVICDGGCASPGDIAKAFGGGADFVMLGGLLSGHDQCLGDVIVNNGRKYKLFYGSASKSAMDKYYGGVAKYRAAEGKTVKVEYKGDVENTVLDILGGLRSACSHTGCSSLEEMHKRVVFVKTSQQLNKMFS